MIQAFDLFYWLFEWSWWPESAHGYAFFSSVGGTFLFSAGIFTYIYKHNCHVHRCPRLSWHPDKDGHEVCKVHNPDHPARGWLRFDRSHPRHAVHLRRTRQ